MIKNVNGIISIIMASLLLVIFILCTLFPGENLQFNTEPVTDLNEDWIYMEPDGTQLNLNLPARLKVEAGEKYAVRIWLDRDFSERKTLCIRTSMQTLQVLLDQDEIYSQGIENPKSSITIPMASMWNLVRLPEDSDGKELTLIFSSPFSSFSGCVNPIVYGTKSAVLYDLLEKYWFGLFVSFLIMLIGFLLITVPLIVRTKDWALFYLGLFSVFISLWLLAESKMLQFFTGNQFIIGGLAYIMLSLFPIPMLLYIRETVVTRWKRIYFCLACAFLINTVLCTLLQITDIWGFFGSLVLTHILLITGIAFTVLSLVLEIIKFKNKNALGFACTISILFTFAAVEFYGFFSRNFTDVSTYVRMGLILYICILGLSSLHRWRDVINKSREAQFFERMAYQDILTGGKNRRAFDNDIEHYFSAGAAGLKDFRLVIFDTNDLKYINDKFGHVTGDEALRKSYDCIEKAFSLSGSCYRIGGDEFACILPRCNDECYQELLTAFRRLVKEIGSNTAYPFEIAVGSAVFDPHRDSGFQGFLNRTDQAMYENKESFPDLYLQYL